MDPELSAEGIPAIGPNVFRPGLLWRAVNSLVGCVLMVPTVIFITQYPTPLVMALGIPSGVVCALMMVRPFRARVAYSRTQVLVYGVLWSRTIERARIESVDTETYAPVIFWKTTKGWPMFTPLTALAVGNPLLPASMFARTSRFLARLSSWAG